MANVTRGRGPGLAGVAGLLGLLGVIGPAEPAGASITGPCQATIAGQDVGPLSGSDPSDAIKVKYSDTITVQASTNAPVGAYEIQLEVFGRRWTIANGSSDTSSWTRDAKVSTYTDKVKSGGLVKVIGTGGGCTGSALLAIDYQGKSPLSTPLGFAGVALTAVGIGSIAATGVNAARRVAR